jgi:eukaryotic-like serine/threonine-protein kinase
MILPSDVAVVPIAELPGAPLPGLECEPDDWAVLRPGSRSPARLVSEDVARLLLLFRQEKTIVEAVLDYASARGDDPADVLEQAWPALAPFMWSRILVERDSALSKPITASFAPGEWVDDYQVQICIQALEDAEVYRARTRAGSDVALKVVRPTHSKRANEWVEHEGCVLGRVGGSPGPRLLRIGQVNGRSFIAVDWCFGVPITVAAQECRDHPGGAPVAMLSDLCLRLLAAYRELHEKGVLHGDVHPRNALVAADGTVRVIDFGMARLIEGGEEQSGVARGGIPDFYDPELAAAQLAEAPSPPVTAAGEEYSLAALVYLLLAGHPYVDFSREKEAMLRQICEQAPKPFPLEIRAGWPGAEAVVFRALAKRPAKRHGSPSAFAEALSALPARKRSPKRLVAGDRVHDLVESALVNLRPDGPLFRDGIGEGPAGSVTFGAAGIAYGLYRMACARANPALLADADLWAERALERSEDPTSFYDPALEITEATVGDTSPYHTASGAHAVRTIIALARGDSVRVCQGLAAFAELARRRHDRRDLTLGQAGTLLFVTELLSQTQVVPRLTGTEDRQLEELRSLGGAVAASIWEWARRQPPIMDGNALPYLGIAHGWAGLCYATLLWCRIAEAEPPDDLHSRLEQLVTLAQPHARGVRWPIEVRPNHRGRRQEFMPSWCNGAPGFVSLWTEADRRFDEPEYRRLAELAAWNAWEEDNMSRTICCGDAGRAYALLDFYRHSQEGVWLQRAHQVCERGAGRTHAAEELRHSLYKGEFGLAVLVADLGQPEHACQPLFGLL